MGFLWGKKDEFEKDNNTIRGVYKLNPSFGFIDKKKQYEMPVIEYTEHYYSDNYGIKGDMVYLKPEVTLGKYIEYYFGSESYEDSYEILGGMIYGNLSVIKSSYIEYRFLSYPYTGYMSDPYVLKGDVVYTFEVIE